MVVRNRHIEIGLSALFLLFRRSTHPGPEASRAGTGELAVWLQAVFSGCRSPSKTCVSAYYYPVPATGLTLGRMVLTLAFECWVFADYLPSSFVRGRLASLTSQLGDSLASNRFRRTAHVCLGAHRPLRPVVFALGVSLFSCRRGQQRRRRRSPRTNSPPLHAKSHTPTCPAGRVGDHRPDSLAPLPALFAPRPLRDMPVDHLKRIACSAKLFVGSTPGVVTNVK